MIIVNLTTDVPATKKEDIYLSANKQIGLSGALYDDFLRKKFGIDRQSLMKQYKSTNGNTKGTLVTPETQSVVTPKPEGYLNNIGGK